MSWLNQKLLHGQSPLPAGRSHLLLLNAELAHHRSERLVGSLPLRTIWTLFRHVHRPQLDRPNAAADHLDDCELRVDGDVDRLL